MISDNSVRQLTNYIYDEFMVDNVNVDERKFDQIHECLTELLTARQTIADKDGVIERLKEDGERLADCIDATKDVMMQHPLRQLAWFTGIQPALDQHNDLMKEMGAK